jgi:hypothetical protein
LRGKKIVEGDEPMRTQKSLAVAGAGVVICIVAIWLSASMGGEEKVYEVRPQVTTVPEYRTDAARAIDAYERAMERYVELSEKILDRLAVDSLTVDKKLDGVDSKLTELLARTARIEKALGIEQTTDTRPQTTESAAKVKGVPEKTNQH